MRTLIITESEEKSPQFTSFSMAALIDHLADLRTIYVPNHDLVTSAIKTILSMNASQSLKLISLKCDSEFLADYSESLRNLTTVELVAHSDYNFNKLSCLANLTHLHSLSVIEDVSSNYLVDFVNYKASCNESLYDLLRLIGFRLYHLELHLELVVDLPLIALYCPHLRGVELTNVTSISDRKLANHKRLLLKCRHSETDDLLPNLKTLKLLANSDNSITEFDLIEILVNCNQLEYLFVGWCDAFGDAVIDSVCMQQRLPHLQQIELHEMSTNLSIHGVSQLALELEEIKQINLLGCEDISSFDIMELTAMINSLNLNVKIKHQSW